MNSRYIIFFFGIFVMPEKSLVGHPELIEKTGFPPNRPRE